MPGLFGTDGIRGITLSHPITAEFMMQIGRTYGLATRYDNRFSACNRTGNRPSVVIGYDTRSSCCMLSVPLIAAIMSCDVDVLAVGCLPTPAISLFVKKLRAIGGIMISSSHNDPLTNGLKFFNEDGYKLFIEQEEYLEDLILRSTPKDDYSTCQGTGFFKSLNGATETYLENLKENIPALHGIKIALDCANGATSDIAQRLLEELGCTVYATGNQPNGTNINHNCGVLHTENNICRMVPEVSAHIGIAFDGDGDRVLICDEAGRVIDGDQLIARLAIEQHSVGTLKNDSIVCTTMSNMGLDYALTSRGISVIRTPVGERSVVASMLNNNVHFGGEKSGHIIMRQHCTTSDGMAAALQVLSMIHKYGRPVSQEFVVFNPLPQIIKNVYKKREDILHEPATIQFIQKIENNIKGRVLVRASGTEPLIRIMVECNDAAIAQHTTDKIAAFLDR